MNFQKFYFDEKEMYINLDDKPGNQNLGKVDTDDEHYNKKINRIISNLSSEEIDKCLNILTSGKNIKRYENDIKAIFTKYTMDHKKLEVYANTIRGKNSFDLSKNFSLKDMYEYYNKVVPDVVNRKLYTVLYQSVPGASGAGKQIGKGELLLAFLTRLDKSSKGDLVDINGEIIEVKTDRAKFKGGDSNKLINGPAAMRRMSKIIGKDIVDRSVNAKVMSNCYEYFKSNKENSKELLQSFINYNKIEIPKEAIEIANSIKINSAEEFSTFVLSLQAYAYIVDEGIKKIFFFKGSTFDDIQVIILEFTNFENLYNFISKNLKNVGDWTMKAGFSFTFR